MAERVKALVLVKASPVLTRNLEETMCVAGARLDAGGPAWVRLHPVPFRDLDNDQTFAKYQAVDVEVIRSRTDRRPESWRPIRASIAPGESLGTDHGWAQRCAVVESLGEANMCDLVEANRAGSGPGVPSLAVARPAEPPTLEITRRDEAQVEDWRRRAAAARSVVSLFDNPDARKPEFEVVPWRFQYAYRCGSRACNGHEQTIVDWEALALWRHVRHRADWQEQMRVKFEETLWQGRDSRLFVGNQEQRPWGFLVLGVFWPPAGVAQGILNL
jgi:hypothetical protein